MHRIAREHPGDQAGASTRFISRAGYPLLVIEDIDPAQQELLIDLALAGKLLQVPGLLYRAQLGW